MAGEKVRAWCARLAVVVALVASSLLLTRLWGFAHIDDPNRLDQSVVTRTAAAACAQLRDTAAALAVPTIAPVPQRVRAINAQNSAVLELVATMRDLGDLRLTSDQPAERWLGDWERLVTVRAQYARALAAGHAAPLKMPNVEGRSLVDRLNTVVGSCRVPLALLSS